MSMRGGPFRIHESCYLPITPTNHVTCLSMERTNQICFPPYKNESRLAYFLSPTFKSCLLKRKLKLVYRHLTLIITFKKRKRFLLNTKHILIKNLVIPKARDIVNIPNPISWSYLIMKAKIGKDHLKVHHNGAILLRRQTKGKGAQIVLPITIGNHFHLILFHPKRSEAMLHPPKVLT